jgi:hypothetical protein
MRRVFLIVSVSLLLVGVGGVAGWFVSQAGWWMGMSKPRFSYRVGDPDLLATAPSLGEWRYPGSKNHDVLGGSGSTVGEIEFAHAERVVLLTPDGFDKVWNFYADKCHLHQKGQTARVGGYGTMLQGITLNLYDDKLIDTFEAPKSEGFQGRGFLVDSPRYCLTGFIYRLKGADSTCILLVYRPHTEFVSLLKPRLADK